METGRWHGHIFEVSPNVIRDFSTLIVKGGMATDEKVGSKQAFKVVKNSNPVEVSFKVALHAALGCNVRDEAMAFVMDAEQGATDWLYINGTKLIDCTLMLTEADVSVKDISPNGTWVYCELTLQFRQGSQFGGSTAGTLTSSKSSGGGGGSSKSSGGGGGSSSYTKKTTSASNTKIEQYTAQKTVTAASKSTSSSAYLAQTVSAAYKGGTTKSSVSGGTSKITRVTK